ncbi:MAG: hypothetical protein PHH24_01675 [Candidatus Moranbacteria bacterium]|jgi:hypothetical protein|nr:hypothetical protein [Candidatus Moranbacteria bacterium]MDD5652245.1 hypothetical protein [Candidatus Moranbacteria bacterium]MDX9855273.1 hypothetical protein [Candidatus Moranbacteria bacterium]
MADILQFKNKKGLNVSSDTVVIRGSTIRLSPKLVEKFEAESKFLEDYLKSEGIAGGIEEYLNDIDNISYGDLSFKKELLNWGFDRLSSDEGFAWLLKNYAQD